MLIIIRYVYYRLRKSAKKTGGSAELYTPSLTILPIIFYLFSLNNVICIITKREMSGLYWLLIGTGLISAIVYLRKVEKKIDKEFQNISKLKKWVFNILAFLYYVLSVVLLAYTMNYFDTNIRGSI